MTRTVNWGIALLALAAGLALTGGISLAAQGQTRLFGVGQTLPPADAFFSDAALQEVRLTVSTRDWQTLKDNFRENTYYPADFRWRNEVVRNVGIRSRGTGSRSGVKPGLKVDIDRYVSGQRFLGLRGFVLRNNTQDASNMHERLAMLLYKRLGLPYSRESFARLYINDEYAGLYTIVEDIDKPFLKRVFGEDGGYLYEYDYPDDPDTPPYYFDYRGPDASSYVPSPFEPQTHESSPMGEVIERWLWTINESREAFRTLIPDYMDLEKFMRYVAVEQFVTDTDGFLGDSGVDNFYIYRPDGTTFFTFIPWDKSEAFKRSVDTSIFHNIWDVAFDNHLVSKALEYPDLLDAFLNASLECAAVSAEPAPGVAGGWLYREIQREYAQIRDAARADAVKPFSNDDFELEVQRLLAFAQNRSGIVSREVAAYRTAADSKASPRRRRE